MVKLAVDPENMYQGKFYQVFTSFLFHFFTWITFLPLSLFHVSNIVSYLAHLTSSLFLLSLYLLLLIQGTVCLTDTQCKYSIIQSRTKDLKKDREMSKMSKGSRKRYREMNMSSM
jgi:hypothetical protein